MITRLDMALFSLLMSVSSCDMWFGESLVDESEEMSADLAWMACLVIAVVSFSACWCFWTVFLRDESCSNQWSSDEVTLHFSERSLSIRRRTRESRAS